MTHTWVEGEAIIVQSGKEDRPLVILWKGARHPVQKIAESWEICTNWWESGGAICRTYHALITEDGIFCVVFRDLDTGVWYLAKIYD